MTFQIIFKLTDLKSGQRIQKCFVHLRYGDQTFPAEVILILKQTNHTKKWNKQLTWICMVEKNDENEQKIQIVFWHQIKCYGATNQTQQQQQQQKKERELAVRES